MSKIQLHANLLHILGQQATATKPFIPQMNHAAWKAAGLTRCTPAAATWSRWAAG